MLKMVPRKEGVRQCVSVLRAYVPRIATVTVDVDDAYDESQLSTYVCSNRLGVAKGVSALPIYQTKHVSTRMQTLKSAWRRNSQSFGVYPTLDAGTVEVTQTRSESYLGPFFRLVGM